MHSKAEDYCKQMNEITRYMREHKDEAALTNSRYHIKLLKFPIDK